MANRLTIDHCTSIYSVEDKIRCVNIGTHAVCNIELHTSFSKGKESFRCHILEKVYGPPNILVYETCTNG